jgi:hypothetical protein
MVEGWAQQALAEGLIEPSAAVPAAWQITDAGREVIGYPAGRR